MKVLILFLFVATSVQLHAQSKLSVDPTLVGKWKAISKIEIDKTNGVITETDKDLYKAGEKTYEFTKKNTVIIVQGFGKHKEELPAYSQGNKLFVGKDSKNKTPYVVTFEQGKTKLLKTETKIKKGKTIIETEEVILTR
ncbi:hypothetical protein ACFOG5_06710 [Pedobacter fastidiosus]|uniref:Lipocalin-like domain-containing protein n=1 Tax=Pedobacter fastidiosus TaxID=2765361 RepID=A0ABR7KUT9_9SPHI|nr:hypothetical protein [Pedobacter fastidiosus]MBC6111874.1 hypothetical protein [Pedobacter fastidiosus]